MRMPILFVVLLAPVFAAAEEPPASPAKQDADTLRGFYAKTAAKYEFFHDLASRGLVANTKYLSTMQAGTEAFIGSGTLQTNGFYCRVQ